ncbi:YppG family protein [Cytobacillus sp. FSL R7-0696]|uniref:YppG family protein n=1 Tax=Cytobacillus sp. FSL R7-0696 TaxID=2921691 RepID=UPI0030FAFAFD
MFGRKRTEKSKRNMPVAWSFNPYYAPYQSNMSYPTEIRQLPVMQSVPHPIMNGQQQPLWNQSQINYAYTNNYPYQTIPYGNMYPPQHDVNNHQPNYPLQDSPNYFHNPLEPNEQPVNKSYNMQSQYNTMNPYPKQSFVAKQPNNVQSIMNSFKSQDGSLDFNKMMDTAGQMMNAVNQVSSMVKGVGGFFKV